MHHGDVSLMENPVLLFPFLGWVDVNTPELSFLGWAGSIKNTN